METQNSQYIYNGNHNVTWGGGRSQNREKAGENSRKNDQNDLKHRCPPRSLGPRALCKCCKIVSARIQDFGKKRSFSMPRLGYLGVEFQKTVCTPKFLRICTITWRQ